MSRFFPGLNTSVQLFLSAAWCCLFSFPSQADDVNLYKAPEDGGPRNWEVTGVSSYLNLREAPSSVAPVVSRYPPGTLLSNLGCEEVAGQAWCYVQEMSGGPVGYVSANYLKGAVSPDGTVALGSDDSALRAGQGDYDAKGSIPCAVSKGQPMGECDFGVARAGGGYATVVVTRPNGNPRIIYFQLGKPIGAGISEADYPGEFSTRKEGDLNFIRIGDERYEIPDAVVLGG